MSGSRGNTVKVVTKDWQEFQKDEYITLILSQNKINLFVDLSSPSKSSRPVPSLDLGTESGVRTNSHTSGSECPQYDRAWCGRCLPTSTCVSREVCLCPWDQSRTLKERFSYRAQTVECYLRPTETCWQPSVRNLKGCYKVVVVWGPTHVVDSRTGNGWESRPNRRERSDWRKLTHRSGSFERTV